MRQNRLVPVRQFVVQSHHHAVGDDGEDDGPLEYRPVDEPRGQPAERTRGREQEQGRGTLVQDRVGLLPHHSRGGSGRGWWSAVVKKAEGEEDGDRLSGVFFFFFGVLGGAGVGGALLLPLLLAVATVRLWLPRWLRRRVLK